MTSNEIAQRSESAWELLPAARVPSTTARNMLLEHAQNMETAHQLAKAMVRTQMVPKRFFGKADDAAAAILYGAELGLNPIQSLQRVIPIHGMPSLEARTMVGLLKAKGYKVRTVEQSDSSVTVEGVALDGETYSSTWTIQRATQAGYVPLPSSPDSKRRPDAKEDWVTTSKTWDGKTTVSIVGNMKYITDPQTMLKAKAQAEVCRELAPDVLMGISYTREELESEDQRQFDRMDERGAVPARVTTTRVTEDEIFAEEVPLSEPEPEPAKASPTPEAPAEESQQPDATLGTSAGPAEPAPTEPAPKAAKKAAAKRSTAPTANPDAAKSRMRQALEKRLFALLGEAGIGSAVERESRIAVYRALLDNPEIESTDDLDDPAIAKVADQLYSWSQQNELDDQIAGILSDAARDESESAAPATDSASEGKQ
ncbi:RecT-family phage protein [Mycobacteroides abscessus subsp. bolletii]|uniref:RecT-family phage protein n=1 Tax=Mycobacteroides abscessus subsp. bolletii TaxID=319705 RepID=A0A9Q7SEN5_9MYCO|nr:hypothetical protein [Mycobacteroides abscessus]SHT85091.1 RecT-family phage protein [Mycobacteroides abscessus subsp. bolletii]SHU02599.1 RecT-family phage protein [Mycobacteroides abscessus subsp. bolletii]SHX42730.1 RecT-family phage protein [Mycobacteroides abscessus subsp. bolletii]SKM65265.1 RecT-family phage protein [Mycobacteroides abscessus subsp. bolletii]SKN39142.1 RecT-family phage protein [Mycobacteroides abscessus subsp. bolletii]